MSYDHRRVSPHSRRRSPSLDLANFSRRRPKDRRPAGMQIRGLAADQIDRSERSERLQNSDRRDRSHPDQRPDHRDNSRGYSHESHDDQHQRSRRDGQSHQRTYDRRDRRDYRDRDREGYRSPERDFASRGSSPQRRERSPYFGGPPSREVILEGLPPSMTEDDVAKCLKRHQIGELEDIRVIRDRRTGESRQFGFIRFSSMHDARAFLERNYPTILFPADQSSDSENQDVKVRVAFSRERNERDRRPPDSDWTCIQCSGQNFSRRTECYKCKAPKSEYALENELDAQPAPYTNNGDSDVSPDSTPSQYLLFRGLEPGVTEEVLAKGATKLLMSAENPKPEESITKMNSTSAVANAGAAQGSIHRIFLIRDRQSNETWRYGFVEFFTVEDASAAMARYNSMEKFTIASKHVAVSYIHAGVFVPRLNAGPANAANFTFAAAANPSLRVAYWDEEAYANELVIAEPEPVVDDEAHDKAARKKPDTKTKKRKAESTNNASAKKTMPSHLQFWANRHAELHGLEQIPTAQDDDEQNPSTETSSPAAPAKKEVPAAAAKTSATHVQSFADPTKHCCYLCARQFKSAAEVNKHERLSQLHRDNLTNADLVSKAQARLARAGVSPSSSSSTNVANANYRDRASERRTAFNQPKQPGWKGPPTTSISHSATTETTQPDHPTSSITGVPPQSKGAALLSKMGWTDPSTSSSLNPVISDPTASLAQTANSAKAEDEDEEAAAKLANAQAALNPSLYVPGVGLGAEGGKRGDALAEGARRTKEAGEDGSGDGRAGYRAFAERVRDGARERFKKMG